MKNKSITALVSAYARAYHTKVNDVKVFDDSIAEKLFEPEEFNQIGNHMINGINFFNPAFSGDDRQALKWIVDHYISPTPIARAAFAEVSLENAVVMGMDQYLIFAAGYDTFAYRQPNWANNIKIIEIDHPETARDKQMRLKKSHIEIPKNTYFVEADFNECGEDEWLMRLKNHPEFLCEKRSFCSLLGLSYYLSEEAFKMLLKKITTLLPKGSSIVFDYPDENAYTEKASERAKKQKAMADASGEIMVSSYAYKTMEKLLDESDLLIYEHLTPEDITKQYFGAYNEKNLTSPLKAFEHVNYCLAVKK